MEKQSRLEELEIRIDNLTIVLGIIQQELEELLKEQEELKKPQKIGFRFGPKIDDQKTEG